MPTVPEISAVIFDLDGTLIDTLDDIADSMNRVLENMGYPTHPRNDYRYFVGEGMSRLVKRVLPADTDHETTKTCREKMLREYGRSWACKSRPYDGIMEMLFFLRDKGLPLAVLSNKPDRFTVRMCRHFFPQIKFAAVQGFIDVIARKPAPDGALDIATKIAVPPERILYLGDTATDMKCARSAGMTATGVLWGFRGQKELQDNGAEHIISHPMKITDLLAKQCLKTA